MSDDLPVSDERWIYVAETGDVRAFGKALDEKVRQAKAEGYTETLHLSHSLAFRGVSESPLWSAIVVVRPPLEPHT